MKLNTALNCLAALAALDGYTKVIVDGGREKEIHVTYTFTGNVRIAIARNIAALEAENRNYTVALNGLIRQFAGGGHEVPKNKLWPYQVEVGQLLDTECVDLQIRKLSEADLNLETNPLPPTIIASLLPILDDPEAPAA